MPKKLAGLLLLALLITFAANATTITEGCGSVSAPVPAQPGPPFPPFTPTISASLSCIAFPIPAGQTLTDVQVSFKNDWQLGADGGPNTLVFNYTITGFNIGSMQSAVTGLGSSTVPVGTNQGTCSVVGDNVTCDDPVSILGNGVIQFNAIGISVAASWTAGGLDFSGSEGTTIKESLTFGPVEPPPPVPEPASLLMAGSGLIGLALAARRKWKA